MSAFSRDEATKRFRLDANRDLKKTRKVCLHLEDPANEAAETKAKQEQIRQYMHETYELFHEVFQCLNSAEAHTVPPVHKLRHPLIFYLGHTATFYINKLALAGLTTRINHKFEETFAIGVDEMSWDDLNEAHYDWPNVLDVYKYRDAVRQQLDELFNKFTLKLPLTFDGSTVNDDNAFYWAIMMGIEHERIHIETASVHVRELPMKFVKANPFWNPCTDAGVPPKENPLVDFEGGQIRVGRPMDSPVYGWDCDYGNGVTHDVAPFKASQFIVSNADFYEFVKDGGYDQKEWWDEEGWNWVSWKKPQHPWFWVKQADGSFNLRCQVTEIPLPWSWPAEVNNLEATAYCAWMSKKLGKKLRLPTEAEWLHMRDTCVEKDQYQWDVAPGNIDFAHYASSCPVNKFKQGKLYDVVGNVWQHCETPVYPYKGYKVHPLYDDFSMPTFDGRHRCMKGGTWISTGNEASRDSRFAFRRHFYQFIGIRMIEGVDVDETVHMKDVLGLDPEVDIVTQYSYGAVPDSTPIDKKQPYGVTLATMAIEAFKANSQREPKRALDLMCGAGRATYELSMHFESVTGVDFSARMLQPAFAIRERGMATYSTINDDGSGRSAVLLEAAKEKWAARREDVTFYQSDPANLHAHLAGYDLILAFNILSKSTSYSPAAVPPHLVTRLETGGILVVAEPAALPLDVVALLGDKVAAVGEAVKVPCYFPKTEGTGDVVDFTVRTFRKL